MLPSFARHVSFIAIDFYDLKKDDIEFHDKFHEIVTEHYNKGEYISVHDLLEMYGLDEDDEKIIHNFLSKYDFNESDVRIHWDW